VVTSLMSLLKPVPAARGVGVLRLLRVKHEKLLFTGSGIHAGTGSEVVRTLMTAVQHDHKW
jgi:hypothetical protein